MALKDLTSDLSNFKYGISSPDKIDKQIDEGVDFFPNDDAEGFTPKTNLESLYKRIPSGPNGTGVDSQIVNGVDFFPNDDAVGFITDPPSIPSELNLPSSPAEGGLGVTGTESEQDSDSSQGSINPKGSFFHMVNQGTMANTWPEAAISYDKDRLSAFNHYEIPIGYQSQMTLPGDTFTSPWDSFPQFQSPFMVTPIASYESRYPSDASVTWGEGDSGIMNDPVITNPISYDKTRNVYQHHYLNSPFVNISLNSDLFDETGVTQPWKNGSINIFTGDVQAPLGGSPVTIDPADFVGMVDDTPAITNPSVSTTLQIPAINTGQELSGRIVAKADYTGEKNLGPFTFSGDNTLDLDTLISDTRKDEMNDFYDFEKVPAGLNQNMVLQNKSFREVADPFNSIGFRQPFILRPIPTEGDGTPGNGRWGFDAIDGETGGFGTLLAGADGILGDFVPGAPTFTGLVHRNIADKIRIAKFILTPKGVGFVTKQYLLQKLNPDIRTKDFNPVSIFNVVGGDELLDTLENIVNGQVGMDDAVQIISGVGSALASLTLPIGHVERAKDDFSIRYEKNMLNSDSYVPINDILDPEENLPSYGRLAAQVAAFSSDISGRQIPQAGGFLGEFINSGIGDVADILSKAGIFALSNPNKYMFPISSAPKSVKDGEVSFIGGPDLAYTDVENALEKRGGTFNKKTFYILLRQIK